MSSSTLLHNLVIVEGNISAGKSTLCRELSQILNMKEWTEPVIDNPYLDKFYANPKAYALKMQLWLLRHRFLTYLDAIHHLLTMDHDEDGLPESCGVLLDRSIFSDYVFAEKNFRDGNISAEGFKYYNELREQMLRWLPLPAVTLYLDVDAKRCYERIHNMRCRDCETGIQLDYLQGLDECYQIMLRNMQESGTHILRVEWNSFGNVKHVANRLEQTIAVMESRSSSQQSSGATLDRVMQLVNSSELRRSVMYLDYTIAELENDDVAAAISKSSSVSSVPSTPTKQQAGQQSSTASPSIRVPSSPLVDVKNV